VAVAHKYLAEGGVAAEMKVDYGDPVEEIRREALDGGYDLIIVGSRELGPVGRVVLGSVSARLVKESPCPVLVAGEGRGSPRAARCGRLRRTPGSIIAFRPS
jgi:nucleotide-binding universal stress UspA family protein